jgi:hypothetical protein
MNEEEFFERLRNDAQKLRFTPDDVMTTRLGARIRARVAAQPTVSQFLAAWLRPVMASVAALAFTAVMGLTWIERSDNSSNNATMETMGTTSSFEVASGGATFGVAE